MDTPFATALAGWKASGKNRLGWALVPNAADVDSAESMRIAAGVLDALGVSREAISAVPKDPGGPLEQAVCDQLRAALPGDGTGRDWLIRRGQIIRHECLQMIRHRRGRQPHLVTVTAEPLPSRLASIARGTGEVDAVYHIAYDAMAASVAEHANPEQRDAWREVTKQRRVLSYEVLAETLASQ